MGIESEQNALLTGRSAVKSSRRKYITIGVTVLLLIAVIIILIAVISRPDDDSSINWENEFLKGVSPTEAKKNSKLFSEMVHVAATEQNDIYADEILHQFQDMGLETDMLTYDDIYLSQYNGSSLSQVNPSNTDEILYEFDLTEEYIAQDPSSNTSLRTQAWLGYSPSGHVTGYIVYVNYGDAKDFHVLMNELQFDLKNKSVIALVRYGALLRGIKAFNAQKYGFKAVIVFSDPIDYGYLKGDVVPNGPWLPQSGFQRGSAAYLNRCFGNPSPTRAKERCGYDDVSDILPSIPIIPLSYRNAQRLMEQMSGIAVEDNNSTKNWKGGLDLEYTIGTVDETDGVMVSLSTSNIYGPTKIINVRGLLPGYKYTNESIMFGAHRDAWVYGAVDPISGTTSIIEIARAFTTIYKKGWRPKRNILFLSWDAEEFDLIGSTEYAENEEDTIKSELIAYFNQDVAVSGPNFTIKSDPLLSSLAEECMVNIKQPYTSSNIDNSILDHWNENKTGLLGSGSDYSVFVHEYGIASMDAGFEPNDGYGTYHSVYDSYYTMSNYIDPEYEYLRGIAQFVGCMGFRVANQDIIPFKTDTLYKRLRSEFVPNIVSAAIEYNCVVDEALTSQLSNAVEYYGNAATVFDESLLDLLEIEKDELYEETVKVYNNKLRRLGAMFLYDDGLPTRKIYKNLIVAAALDNGYGAHALPFIQYAIKVCDNGLLEKAYNVTANALVNAADYLMSNLA